MPIWETDDIEYHSDHTKIGSTMLKQFRDERRVYEKLYVTREQAEDSNAFRKGRAFHIAVLEPERWDAMVAIDPSKAKTDKHKDFIAFAAELPPGVTPLTKPEAKLVRAMADAVWAHKVARKLLEGGIFERAMWTTHAETGLHIKAKQDHVGVFPDGTHHIDDLKMTKAKTAREFMRAVEDYQYKEQAAYYAHIYQEVIGQFPMFFFIAASNTKLGKVWVCRVTDPVLQTTAWANMDQALCDLAECYRTGNWSDPWETEIYEIV